MSALKASTRRWGIVFLCLLLGTWLGVFFQHFDATALIFKNFVDIAFNVKDIDIVMLKFGIFFGLKINLGTIFGGAIGVWLTR
jgi:hypothetical protein